MFSAFRGLGPYVYRHRRQWILGNLAILGAVAAALQIPRVVGQVIDRLNAGARTATPADDLASGDLVRFALTIVALTVVDGSLLLLMRRQVVVGARQVVYEIRRDVFARLTTLDQGYYHRTRTGDLMSRLTGDLNAVQEMMGWGFMQLTRTLALFIGTVSLMIGLSAPLGLLVLGVIPVIGAVLIVLMRKISRRYVRVQEQLSAVSARAQENFSGIRVVKGYAVEDRETAEYRAMNDEYRRRVLSLARVEGPLWGTVGLVMNSVYVAVLLIGGGQLIRGGAAGGLTVGEFVQFSFYLFQLGFPMLMIGQITMISQRGASSWGRLREVLDAESAIEDEGRTDRSVSLLEGTITFERVGLKVGGRTLLQDVSLRVPKGMTLGITGRTGAGKSLLASLVGRALDPTSGRVLVDGRDVRTIPLQTLRRHIGYVPQEPFLFSDTIANNIAFGLPESTQTDHEAQPDPETVRWAAKVAGLAKDVEDFPNGYETLLGERGVTLSGGQRQRTALARAIARRPEILVLDDSMSAVDTETESRILGELKTVLENRTVLLIGHRVSTLRHADHIVVLDHGRIVEQGSHEELLARGGLYAEMDRKQGLASALEGDEAETAPEVEGGVPAETGAALLPGQFESARTVRETAEEMHNPAQVGASEPAGATKDGGRTR